MPAPQVSNPGTNGSNARYYVEGLQWDPARGAYVDDAGWHYDANGLSLDRPDSWMTGLPPANESESYSTWGAQPSGTVGASGGATGDLTASPYYQQYQSQIQAAQAADLSSTKSALQQLLIAFGLVPEGFQDKYGALDDTIKQLIQKNTDTGVSQYARLMESKKDARNAAIANLAKRGLTRSGAKGYALRRGTLDFDRSLSDALSGVLGQANQLQGGYASREMDRQANLASLLAQLSSAWRPSSTSGGNVPRVPSVPQSTDPGFSGFNLGMNLPVNSGLNTIDSWINNAMANYQPAGSPGGFTSPKKPLLYA